MALLMYRNTQFLILVNWVLDITPTSPWEPQMSVCYKLQTFRR